jgi:phenylalanyl-tRNA synthetase alpha chain
MSWNFEAIKTEALAELDATQNLDQLEAFRIRYLGKKGLVSQMFTTLATLPPEEKPQFGQNVNQIRQFLTDQMAQRKHKLLELNAQRQDPPLDHTLPGGYWPHGRTHLIHQTIDDICAVFQNMGFSIHDGPEMETEFHNFSALNIPEDHPSRDGFDTFYLNTKDPDDSKKTMVLRSHTSPGQIRIMNTHQPPLAVLIPGRVYRPDAVDASHSFMFHQIEGLLVSDSVNFAELKGLLRVFCHRFFGEDIAMRFRPHYFPFTEPSAEVDIMWKKGKKKWLEIMGCGLVHPVVFEAVGYPKNKWTGLAFGMGVERIAMLKHHIQDIRYFYESDQRFLNQF